MKNPEQMLQTDPIAKEMLARYKVPMPNQNLSDDEIASTSRTSSGPMPICVRRWRSNRRLTSQSLQSSRCRRHRVLQAAA